ncbi:MAG: hypothetical protein ABSG51_05725 [Terracidiphilus sp.]
MFFKGGALAISVMAMMALPGAMAQKGDVPAVAAMGDDGSVVLGQPLEGVEKIVEVKPLADGTTITKRVEERKWRDAEGRFRKEATQVQEGGEAVYHRATILDPVNNTVTTLDLDNKEATVIHLPEEGPGMLHPYVDLFYKPMEGMPGMEVKFEELRRKEFAGVSAIGRRVTRTRPPGTIGNDRTIVSVSERWWSPELKLLLYSSMDDPREKLTREVTQLDRGEPDPSMFTVPSDFSVRDVPVAQARR